MENLAINDSIEVQLKRVVPLKIGDSLCYPVFLCLHAKNPGHEQLQRDLQRYRSTKQVLKQMFIDGQNYAASDEWLHSKLFAENSEGVRLMWEYTNMIFLSITSEESRNRFSREISKIEDLNKFHDKYNTLPLSEEKELISLFRSAMGMDSWVEEFVNLQDQANRTIQPIHRNPMQEESKDVMEITEDFPLKELYIDPMEKFMDEFTGTGT